MNLGKENETIEFKKSTGELKEAMISISAMLNKHGFGVLYFGVKPNGDVIGQEVSDSSLRDVSRAVYETIKPQIYPVIDEVVIENKHLIKVEFSGAKVPYSAMGRYYLRTADEDREVSPEELKEFFLVDKYRGTWEKEKSLATIDQVDKKSVQSFWRHAISIGRIPKGKYSSSLVLKKFGLVDGDNLTNAGEILFGNTRPVTLKMGIFVTDEKLTFLDMQMAEDNVYNLVGIAEEYIFKNMRWRPLISKGEREEIPEIPLAVIREVLANSFAHAMYNGRTNHEICIYPNKITIYSPGEYASKYTPEEYIEGNAESEIRNYIISKVLYLNGTIEQFGSGFKRIYNLCKRAGIECSYENAKNGFRFIIHRPILNSSDNENVSTNVSTNVPINAPTNVAATSKNVTSIDKNVTYDLENVTYEPENVTYKPENVTYQGKNVTYQEENVTSNTENVTSNVTSFDNLSKNEKEVLTILMEQERLSREEIAERMLKTVRTVQRLLNSLREKGYIQRIGAKRFYTWEVVKNVRNNK